MRLLDRRMIVVAGKGGVGRTTTAVCIGLAAAARGKRVAVVELHGSSGIPELWGLGARQYAARALAPGVDTFSMTPGEAIDDFATRRLKVDALVRMVFHNRIAESFLDAVPGLHDLIQLGKLKSLLVHEYARDLHYDLIVIDAPATGHGLTLLASPRSMAEMTRVGPFYEEARQIEGVLSDPTKTGLVLVTLPEELPINESLQLAGELGPDQPLLAGVVVNQVLRNPLPAGLTWPRMREVLETGAHPGIPPLLALAERTADRYRAQYRSIDRLVEGLPATLGRTVPVGQLYRTPGAPGRHDLPALAKGLDPLWEAP